ncbi:hypothetical protein PQX77_009814 [Marasmius sp. AFHP31]|nr:hypothetical protein PQX77_009814 [Marasmius sp. AFHP31]
MFVVNDPKPVRGSPGICVPDGTGVRTNSVCLRKGMEEESKKKTIEEDIENARSIRLSRRGQEEWSSGDSDGQPGMLRLDPTHEESKRLPGSSATSFCTPTTSSPQSSASSSRSAPATSTSSPKRFHPGDGEEIADFAKQSQGLSSNDYLAQCAGYASNMLNFGGLRTHAIGGLVDDDQLQLLYYDLHGSGDVYSEPFSMV